MGDMNYNPYENNPNEDPKLNPYGIPPYKYPLYQKSNGMERASTILGVCSIIGCTFIYFSIPAGALAILFALLSRGGRNTMSAKSRNGLLLGIAGIVITIIFYAYALHIAIQDAGSFENLLREACEMLGYDFEALFGQ